MDWFLNMLWLMTTYLLSRLASAFVLGTYSRLHQRETLRNHPNNTADKWGTPAPNNSSVSIFLAIWGPYRLDILSLNFSLEVAILIFSNYLIALKFDRRFGRNLLKIAGDRQVYIQISRLRAFARFHDKASYPISLPIPVVYGMMVNTDKQTINQGVSAKRASFHCVMELSPFTLTHRIMFNSPWWYWQL